MKKMLIVTLMFIFLLVGVLAIWTSMPQFEVGEGVRVKIGDSVHSLQDAINSNLITGNAISEPVEWTDILQWHDAKQVRVKIGEVYYSLQDAIDGGLIGGNDDWLLGAWSECSAACAGTQTRTVTCKLGEGNCEEANKPEESRQCNYDACTWQDSGSACKLGISCPGMSITATIGTPCYEEDKTGIFGFVGTQGAMAICSVT